MFWGKFPIIATALVVSAYGLAGASPAQAGVVVKSSGPSATKYPVGTKLEDTDTITLRSGDAVTVLTDSGTRVLRGPGTHRVGARGPSKRTAFAMLTRQRSGARVRTGAVRGGEALMTRNPNLWNVDVSRPGKMCLVRGGNIGFWRPDNGAESVYIFGSAVSDYQVDVTFAEGEQLATLSSVQLPLAENRVYDLSGPNGGASQRVEFVMLDSSPEEPEALAQVLASKGCAGQLSLMAESLVAE